MISTWSQCFFSYCYKLEKNWCNQNCIRFPSFTISFHQFKSVQLLRDSLSSHWPFSPTPGEIWLISAARGRINNQTATVTGPLILLESQLKPLETRANKTYKQPVSGCFFTVQMHTSSVCFPALWKGKKVNLSYLSFHCFSQGDRNQLFLMSAPSVMLQMLPKH